MKTTTLILGAAILAAAVVPALAQQQDDPAAYGEQQNDQQYDDRAPARLRYLEGSVVLQRASDTGSEEARANSPFLPGDRLWTQASGRVEVQFSDGSILRLDSRSKLDYDNIEGSRVVLKMWSGGAILRRTRGDSLQFTITTPDGIADVAQDGRYRFVIDANETRVDVIDGDASFDSGGRRLSLTAGERITVRDGQVGEVQTAYADSEFDYWSEDRDRATVTNGASRDYLPEEVQPYEDDFDRNGSWEYADAEVGHVWRPRVGGEWTPYNDGGWVWTDYGWTWVPNESWGWPAFHYGRWGRSVRLGWYWIPGRRFSPAWVSWAVNDRYVGWCALGFRDRPLYVNVNINNGRDRFRGHATPRSNWTYANRGDLGRQRRGRAGWVRPDNVADLKVFDSPAVRLDRKLEPTRTIARINRGPGDVVPELRNDPKYLHINPRASVIGTAGNRDGRSRNDNASANAGGRSGAVPERARAVDPNAGRVWRTRPEARQETGRANDREPQRPQAQRPEAQRPQAQRPETQRPDVRVPESGRVWRSRPVEQRGAADTPEARRGTPRVPQEPVRSREQTDDASREAMRRFFRPAEEGRNRGGGSFGGDTQASREGSRGRGSAHETEARQRPPQNQPRPAVQAPPQRQAPPPPRQAPRTERAAPRERPRNNQH